MSKKAPATRMAVLGFVLAALIAVGIQPAAGSESVPSPYQQMRDGTSADDVVCAGDRILVQSASGMPACVFVKSIAMLEQRGFILLSEVPRDAHLASQPDESKISGKPGSSPDALGTDYRPFLTTWRTALPNESITIPVGNATGTYTVDWGDGNISANVAGDQIHVYKDAGTYTVAIAGDFGQIYINEDWTNSPKLRSIEQWGDISWTSMNSAFSGAHNMIYNADDIPDLSRVTDMSKMFINIYSFNGDLSDWDVSGVTDMSYMFAVGGSFNSDLSDWDVSNVTDMSGMFLGARSFNGDLSDWDVSSVTDMSGMLSANSFNSDLSSWDVSGVTDMFEMFSNANSFNSDLSSWDVSGVTEMSGMFLYTPAFNQNLGNWYVVLDNASIDIGSGAKKIGNIAAQNPILDSQNPTYSIGSGGDSAFFAIDGGALLTKPSTDYSGKTQYAINITSAGGFGMNNFRVIDVTVTGTGDAGPSP